MVETSEVQVIATIDEAIGALEDQDARERVLLWAWDRFSKRPPPAVGQTDGDEVPQPRKGAKAKPRKGQAKGRTHGQRKSRVQSLSIVKTLNLKPAGKKSLRDFMDEKKPSSNGERATASVYYLKNELVHAPITVNDVYTCFKHMGWRTPADLVNAVQKAASEHGWLDSKKKNALDITTHGDNLVEHDLPRKQTPK